jgi:hypothetical protein
VKILISRPFLNETTCKTASKNCKKIIESRRIRTCAVSHCLCDALEEVIEDAMVRQAYGNVLVAFLLT